LDNQFRLDLPSRSDLAADLDLELRDPVVLVTMQPTTLGTSPRAEASAVAAAMEAVPATYVITAPNADPGGTEIADFWRGWATGRNAVRVVDALGEARYWGMLQLAAAVLGNSSSGIIEAPQAGVPAVNVGDRQHGRLRGRGVRDAPAEASAITAALRAAVDPLERARIAAAPPPYPRGPAAPRILAALAAWDVPAPPRKRFLPLP